MGLAPVSVARRGLRAGEHGPDGLRPVSLLDRELVMVSPLPPRRSGIAAYTAELVAALGRRRRVLVVVERAADIVDLPGAEVTCLAGLAAAPWLAALPHVYQLGNNADHGFVLHACLRRPGLLVLHDPVLHHLVEELTLGLGDRDGYAAVLRHCHGAAGAQVARLRELGVFSDAQRYRMPLHDQMVAAARGVLVHSAHAAGGLRGARPGRVRVVRHHVSPAVWGWDGVSQAEARRRLGVAPEVPLLLSLGFATGPKQLPLVLRALARLREAGQDFHYVIGGAAEAALELPRLVEKLGLAGRVTLTGWLAEDAFFTWARAADLLVNLRFPVGGETSGTLARALGMGLPALVFDHGPAAEWPDEAVFKLAFSADPLPGLAARLGGLLADRAGLAAKGRRAMLVARAEASVALSAEAYLAAIRDWGLS